MSFFCFGGLGKPGRGEIHRFWTLAGFELMHRHSLISSSEQLNCIIAWLHLLSRASHSTKSASWHQKRKREETQSGLRALPSILGNRGEGAVLVKYGFLRSSQQFGLPWEESGPECGSLRPGHCRAADRRHLEGTKHSCFMKKGSAAKNLLKALGKLKTVFSERSSF